MSQLQNNQSEELRYERKFLITDYSAAEVEQILKFHPACFKEVYTPRRINNIYFDSPGFESYYENVEGERDRVKARIRWYGELFGPVAKPTLEFKVKRGLLGRKDFFELDAFELNKDFSRSEIVKALNSQAVPAQVRNLVLSLHPSLLNSYIRKYFISADHEFRLTVDKDQVFYSISYNANTFLNKTTSHAVVLEMKYNADAEERAKHVGSLLPFRMTKNSKYLYGLQHLMF